MYIDTHCHLHDEKLKDTDAVVKEYLTTASDGKKYKVVFYSLEMIMAVGTTHQTKRLAYIISPPHTRAVGCEEEISICTYSTGNNACKSLSYCTRTQRMAWCPASQWLTAERSMLRRCNSRVRAAEQYDCSAVHPREEARALKLLTSWSMVSFTKRASQKSMRSWAQESVFFIIGCFLTLINLSTS